MCSHFLHPQYSGQGLMMRPTLAQSPHHHTSDTEDAVTHGHRQQSGIHRVTLMSMVISFIRPYVRAYLIHNQLNFLSTNSYNHSLRTETCHLSLRIFCRPSCCFIAAAGAGWQMEENSCKYFPNTVNNSLAKYPALRRRCSHKPRFASSIQD